VIGKRIRRERARRAKKVGKRRRKGTVAEQGSLEFKQQSHLKRKPQLVTKKVKSN